MEGVPSNSLRGVPSYEFDGLNNSVNYLPLSISTRSKFEINTKYLMLNTRILSLGVLTNEYSVHIVIRCFETLDGHTGSNIGEEIESNSIALDRLNRCVGNNSFTTLKDGRYTNFFPLNWDLYVHMSTGMVRLIRRQTSAAT
ncbi:hypothetical protein C0993_002123 [Termitomyces sp. T159_Od127]|nr:hypothetical protein C0993_002123 [Termitomyces sp. T159_Od127]